MGLIKAIFGPSFTVGDAREFLRAGSWKTGTFGKSSSGVSVDEYKALTYSAIYAAISLISNTVGQLPLVVRQRTPRGSELADAYPQFFMLHDEPNPWMTAITFKRMMQANLFIYGAAFAHISRNNRTEPARLWPIPSPHVKVIKAKNRITGDVELAYEVMLGGESFVVPQANMVHIPDLTLDGVNGCSRVSQALNAVGLGLATEEFGAKFFSQGAFHSGFLTHEGKLSAEARKQLTKSIEEEMSGPDNLHKLFVLWEGMKFTSASSDPEKSQFLETRKFQIDEIARFFNIPPHMLGQLDRATFSNIEQMSLEFVTYTMMPHFVSWEQELNRKIFTPGQKGKLFTKFKAQALLRGDAKSRSEFYKSLIEIGVMSRNEARELEDMNKRPGADALLQPMNMGTVGGQSKPKPDPARDQDNSNEEDDNAA